MCAHNITADIWLVIAEGVHISKAWLFINNTTTQASLAVNDNYA